MGANARPFMFFFCFVFFAFCFFVCLFFLPLLKPAGSPFGGYLEK